MPWLTPAGNSGTAEKNYSAIDQELLAIVWALKHFRPYLYGRQFIIVTDNQPITYLKTQKDPKGRLARWLHEICSYDFDIKHRPGKHHQDADALSRFRQRTSAAPPVCGATVLEPSKERLHQQQLADPDLRCVIKQLATGDKPKAEGEWRHGTLRSFRRIWSELEMSDGILVKVSPTNGQKLTVLPRVLRRDALQHLHDEVLGGHMRVEKTNLRIHEKFY